jgi:hypothetical protein
VLGFEDAPDLAALDRQVVLGELLPEPVQRPMAGGRDRAIGGLGRDGPRLGDHPAPHVLVVRARTPAARDVIQAGEAVRVEALDPGPNGVGAQLQPRGDRRDGLALGRELDDPGPHGQTNRRGLGARQTLDLGSLFVAHLPHV